MLGSYLHEWNGEEVVISADSRGYHWINVTAGERLSFELNVEDFKLTPLEGSDHDIEITFEMDQDVVIAAIREDVRYERMIGIMETKVREEPVHLYLPEVERKTGGHIHAFICCIEDYEDWRDFTVLALIATNAYLNSGIPAVIVDDPSPADDDAIQDLLDRLQPNQVTIFRTEDEKLQGQIKGSPFASASATERTCNTFLQLNEFIATIWAGEIKRAVVVSNAHYGNALLATSLACLMQSPLFVTNSAEDLLQIKDFATYPLLVVGEDLAFADADVISIPNMAKAMSYLKEEKMNINYVALTNPLDRKTKIKLSLTAPMYAAAHGGIVLPLQDVDLETATSLDAPPLTKVKEQLSELYKALGQPRFLNLVGTTESVPACKTTEDVNESKQYAVTDYHYATVNFNLDDVHEIAVGRCFTDSSTAGFLLATRSVNFPVLRAAGAWKDKIVDAGLWGFPELRKIFWNADFSLADNQKDEMKPLHAKDFETKESIEAAAILHKDHSGWAGLGQCIRRDTNVILAPCVMLSMGCHAAGIDEGCPSCASRVMARGGICYTGAARCPTAIATLWSVSFFNALVTKNQSLGEANQAAHNAFLAHHFRGLNLGKYTLVNRFVLGDPALRPYSCKNDVSKMARHSFDNKTDKHNIVITGPAEWSMVPVHPDQLKEWKYEGTLFDPVAPGAAPEAHWCGDGYDGQVPYYQLVVKVPPKTKGVVMKQLIYNKDSKDITVEAADVSDVDPVCGEYECSQYIDKGKGNDWHYVTVTKGEGDTDTYKWSNRAGVSWTLDSKTLDIDESCPYFKSGAHNKPQRNAQNIVTSMIFQGEAYNRVDYNGSLELAEARKLWWPGEVQNLKDLSDGNKLLLLPLKMIEYDQKKGELQAFVKSCTFEVLTDSDSNEEVDLAELNKMPTVAERGGGRGIALAMQSRNE